MSNYNKGINVWRSDETRKDYYHTSSGHFMSYYPKKKYRKTANIKLRRWKGDIGQNSWYKRFAEVMWAVV